MIRKQIYLTENLAEAIRQTAFKLRISESELVRMMAEEYLMGGVEREGDMS